MTRCCARCPYADPIKCGIIALRPPHKATAVWPLGVLLFMILIVLIMNFAGCDAASIHRVPVPSLSGTMFDTRPSPDLTAQG